MRRKYRLNSQIIIATTKTVSVNQTTKIWVVMAKVEEIQARSIDKVLILRKKPTNI